MSVLDQFKAQNEQIVSDLKKDLRDMEKKV